MTNLNNFENFGISEAQDEQKHSEEQIGAHTSLDDDTVKTIEPDTAYPPFDVSKIIPIEHETRSATGFNSTASLVRVINTMKNGKRVVLKEQVLKELGLTQTVQAGLMGDVLVLKKSGISDTGYNLRKQGKEFVIYNSGLVNDITKALDLDFTERSSINLEVWFDTEKNTKVLMARK